MMYCMIVKFELVFAVVNRLLGDVPIYGDVCYTGNECSTSVSDDNKVGCVEYTGRSCL